MAPRGRAKTYRRVELRFATDDALLAELSDEAAQRGVELQQHLYDLLRGRYLLRHGRSLHDLLWLSHLPAATSDDEPLPLQDSTSAAAGAWMAFLDAEE